MCILELGELLVDLWGNGRLFKKQYCENWQNIWRKNRPKTYTTNNTETISQWTRELKVKDKTMKQF